MLGLPNRWSKHSDKTVLTLAGRSDPHLRRRLRTGRGKLAAIPDRLPRLRRFGSSPSKRTNRRPGIRNSSKDSDSVGAGHSLQPTAVHGDNRVGGRLEYQSYKNWQQVSEHGPFFTEVERRTLKLALLSGENARCLSRDRVTLGGGLGLPFKPTHPHLHVVLNRFEPLDLLFKSA